MYIIHPRLKKPLASAVPAFSSEHTHLETGRNHTEVSRKSTGEFISQCCYHYTIFQNTQLMGLTIFGTFFWECQQMPELKQRNLSFTHADSIFHMNFLSHLNLLKKIRPWCHSLSIDLLSLICLFVCLLALWTLKFRSYPQSTSPKKQSLDPEQSSDSKSHVLSPPPQCVFAWTSQKLTISFNGKV